MATTFEDAKFVMKITIANDECPELFRALSRIADGKRRAGRFKDLASKGLLLERSTGLQRDPETSTAPTGDKMSTQGAETGCPDTGATVGEMVDWSDPQPADPERRTQ